MTPQMVSLTDLVIARKIKEKVQRCEPLTAEEIKQARCLLDWLDLHSLEDKGFPKEWTA